jgi:hypothetical protein
MGASARGRRGVGVVVVLASLLWLAAPPAAAQLRVTPGPLPGSSFQGGDGNQADEGGVDWQTFVTTGRVRHSPDADPDSIFEAGTKETAPGEWDLTTGSVQAKSNILDAWTAVDQPGADTFLYLAFAREGAQGDTFLTFELNHDPRLWNNEHADIPCRRTGDVQVSYEAGTQGVDVVIRQWITTEADDATGCATAGRLEDFAELTANVNVQGAVNGAEIPSDLSFLPGVYDTVPPLRFGEASLNLAALLKEAFGEECLAFNSVWMHSRASQSISSNMEDYVAPERLAVRTCSASGTKFFDANNNHDFDPGERGVPRFLIWADYDNDGVDDPGEPSSVTDNEGQYVIYDIQRPYTLRERLVRPPRPSHPIAAAGWVCSFPTDSTPDGGTGSAPDGRFGCGWGPIDPAATPNATGRDFGNWFPARLTIEKEIEPISDPGRFDLLRDGQLVLPAAGDGDHVTMRLPPGTYSVSERPAPGTDPASYDSTVECRRDAPDRGQTREGVGYEGLELAAGDQATCTFRNIRKPPPPTPAIAIRKTGPETATAGDTLRYRLYVTNPGDVPFEEGAVAVRDPRCDRRPRLVSKQGDDTPGTLDPGDEWLYRCSRQTASGERCVPRPVDNTARVIGTAAGTSVTDKDSITTFLLCPDDPEPPDPEPPDPEPIDPPGPEPPLPPDEPGPVAPAGPEPPNAGDSGIAGIIARQATRACIPTRLSGVSIRGTRIAAVRIFVNGHLERRLTPRILQRRARARLRLTPGRYRMTARVRFQNGSGTPPVTLRRVIRICRPPAARCPSRANPARQPHSQQLLSHRPASARPRAQAAC